MYIDAPCSRAINGYHCLLEGNVVSSTRHLAVLVVQPHDDVSNGVELRNNTLIETGESRAPFPGLLECMASGQCTRNCTGKRFELQQWFRCTQCAFTKENNLGW